jgi:hypothetical protein
MTQNEYICNGCIILNIFETKQKIKDEARKRLEERDKKKDQVKSNITAIVTDKVILFSRLNLTKKNGQIFYFSFSLGK